jgi:hypothetical protein
MGVVLARNSALRQEENRRRDDQWALRALEAGAQGFDSAGLRVLKNP